MIDHQKWFTSVSFSHNFIVWSQAGLFCIFYLTTLYESKEFRASICLPCWKKKALGFFFKLKDLELQWNLWKLKIHVFSLVFFCILGMKETLIKGWKVGRFLLENEKAWLNWFSDTHAFKKNNIYSKKCIRLSSTLSLHTLSFLPTCGFFFHYIEQALTDMAIIA